MSAMWLLTLDRPLLLRTRCRSIWFGPAGLTVHTADPDPWKPGRLKRPLPFSSLLPTDTIFRLPTDPPPDPPKMPATADRMPPISPRLISTVPCSGPAVPDWKFEFRCTCCATTSRLVILSLTGPSAPTGMFDEVIVIWWKFLVMTCVRNGNPAIDTVGFFGKPCFCICVAASLSAKAFAPKSSATSSTRMDRIQMSALRPPRRFGCWYWYKRRPPVFQQARRAAAARHASKRSGNLAEVDDLDLTRSSIRRVQELPARRERDLVRISVARYVAAQSILARQRFRRIDDGDGPRGSSRLRSVRDVDRIAPEREPDRVLADPDLRDQRLARL